MRIDEELDVHSPSLEENILNVVADRPESKAVAHPVNLSYNPYKDGNTYLPIFSESEQTMTNEHIVSNMQIIDAETVQSCLLRNHCGQGSLPKKDSNYEKTHFAVIGFPMFLSWPSASTSFRVEARELDPRKPLFLPSHGLDAEKICIQPEQSRYEIMLSQSKVRINQSIKSYRTHAFLDGERC
ncbi:hypothetical protein TNCV_1232591 [Trichonephila clavipes]|nr:hypothetical protein TNCV_1232591 [Trichonephila clavipes]